MEQKRIKIINGRILTPSGIIKGYDLVIENDKIAEITDRRGDIPGALVIDAEGLYVSPGCIDMHVHGGDGHDFMEATPEAFHAISQAHALHGTTAIYPTLAACPIRTIEKAIRTCEYMADHPKNGARIMGLHLEGNYLNMKMKGGQNADCIALPDPEEYQALLNGTKCIKRWSAAPELKGALEFGRYASGKGVLVSLAHTVADYPKVKEAFRAGYTHATHFYNAMTGVHKDREFKHEGTIESVYLLSEMTVEVVADGIHVPSSILELVYKIKGVERTALVTDAMFAAAWSAVDQFDDERLIIEDGVCKLADRSALAGSIATADCLIRTMVKDVGIPLHDAVRMASETPARIMHVLDRKGTLEKGKDADIIIFDEDIHIRTTFVEGTIIKKEAEH